jgi:hypothetical protein
LSKSTFDIDDDVQEGEEDDDDYSIDESRNKHKHFDDSTSATPSGNNKFFREPEINSSFTSFTTDNETSTHNNGIVFKKHLDESSSRILISDSKKTKKTKHQKQAQDSSDFIFTLYIQMRLCDFTLKHYIHKRNLDVHLCPIENKNRLFKENDKLYSSLFRQILCGVNYMHSKSIIHRDLKVNIIYE